MDTEVQGPRCACTGSSLSGALTQQASTQPELGADIRALNMSVTYLTASILRVKIGAAGRWEVPMSLFNATLPQGEALSGHFPLGLE